MNLVGIIISLASMIYIVKNEVKTINSDEVRIRMENWAMNVKSTVDVRKLIREKRKILTAKNTRETSICTDCKVNLQVLFDLYRSGVICEAQIYDGGAMFMCPYLTKYNADYVCRGILKRLLPILIYIMANVPEANAGSFCGLILQTANPDDCPIEDARYDFTIPLPPLPCDFELDEPECCAKPLKIVHLSDPQLDFSYTPGAISYCDAPLCCRPGVNATAESSVAGYWGDYGRCDGPVWAFHDTLDNVIQKTNNEIDMVYYTGDLVNLANWEVTIPGNEKIINYVYDRLRETFKGIPLFPCLGETESYPDGAFAPPEMTDPTLSTSWLYELMVTKWSAWLPPYTFETIRKGGYYTVLVKPGFRIISINSAVACTDNWWIPFNPRDPGDQLQWLVDTLYEAEKAKERVHILSHILPGEIDVYNTWGINYQRIIKRFSNIIQVEFTGHKAADEFRIYYCKDDIEDPCLVAWAGGSMSPYDLMNINFKIYSIDCNSYKLIDYTNYIYNITEANLTPYLRPRWFIEYIFKEAYGLESLEAKDMDQLVNRLATNRTLLNQYIDFYGVLGDAYLQYVEDSRQEQGRTFDFKYVCDIVKTKLGPSERCEQLREIFDFS